VGIARLLASGINPVAFAFLATVHAVLLFAHRPLEARNLPDSAPLVIVLDAGARFDRGVQLVREGRADWIHFSAGEGNRISEIYAERARVLLPDATITTESRSLTTLQNAVFSMEELGTIPAGTILVTDNWHLFRAWLSFRWAGAEQLHLAPATDSGVVGLPTRRVLREAVAVWLNAGRVATYSALRLLGRNPDSGILASTPLA
jgi:uncharacterized SAM-binding protein YcdF (DUF218 family)